MAKRLPDRKTERCVDCDFIELHSYVCQHDDGPSGELDIRKIHPDCPLDDYNLPMEKPIVDPIPYLRQFIDENEVHNADEMVEVDMSEAWDVVMYLLLACGFGDLVPDGYKNLK